MGTAAKWFIATIVVIVAATYAEKFWPNGSIYLLAVILLGVAIKQGTFGSELSAIARMFTG